MERSMLKYADRVAICHGNPGGWQFSYRYATILLPWMFLLLAGDGPAKLSLIEVSLFAASVAIKQWLCGNSCGPIRLRLRSGGTSIVSGELLARFHAMAI
jgi:hypothetical protein